MGAFLPTVPNLHRKSWLHLWNPLNSTSTSCNIHTEQNLIRMCKMCTAQHLSRRYKLFSTIWIYLISSQIFMLNLLVELHHMHCTSFLITHFDNMSRTFIGFQNYDHYFIIEMQFCSIIPFYFRHSITQNL